MPTEEELFDFLYRELCKDLFIPYIRKLAKDLDNFINPNCDGCIHINLQSKFEPCKSCKRTAWEDYYEQC